MAIAKATPETVEELRRYLGILSKDVDQMVTQFQDKDFVGPAIDSKIPFLQTALQNVMDAV